MGRRAGGLDDDAVLATFAGVGRSRLGPARARPSCLAERHVTGDDRVVAPARRAVDARQVDVLRGGLDRGGGAGPDERAPAEQVPVEVFAEHAADEVQRDRVHARVDEAQAEADDAERVPVVVVHVQRVRVEVEPHHEHVVRQEADHEYDDERQHHLGHLLAGAYLARLAGVLQLARHVARGHHQVVGHQHVEAPDHAQRHRVVREHLEHDHALCVAAAQRHRERVAELDRPVRRGYRLGGHVRERGRRRGQHHGQYPYGHGRDQRERLGRHVPPDGVHDGAVPVRKTKIRLVHILCDNTVRYTSFNIFLFSHSFRNRVQWPMVRTEITERVR